MSQIITAPQPIIQSSNSVFLAGAIDMGAAVDWQAWIIEQTKDMPGLVFFNPRRPEFTADTLDEQIVWELDALESAARIFMWFPKEAKAPISFFESGLYWRSAKLIVGAEPGFYRRRNLELTGSRYGIWLHTSLEAMLKALFYSLGVTPQ